MVSLANKLERETKFFIVGPQFRGLSEKIVVFDQWLMVNDHYVYRPFSSHADSVSWGRVDEGNVCSNDGHREKEQKPNEGPLL